ncbi:IclR family transcriptional regulator [Rathayibacter soli]|uniref:IclR family transcriptional regulator n=1 Tax=Rathayibacter soli TaxID=3144168 RepID=UPI0027E5985D|nr:IclR family transcriptional regulator [Glaciibacter superstes]
MTAREQQKIQPVPEPRGQLRPQQREAAGNRSAERVLRILELIGASPAGLSAAEIAMALDLTPSTTYRLLGTLQRQDYIGRQRGDHRYILGRTVDELSRALSQQLVATPGIRATLRNVHDTVHAAAYLTVFRGDDIAVAHIEDSPEHPRIGQLHVGFSDASHVTAFGKLMLAAKDDAGLERFLERHSPLAFTPRSVTDLATLREQLDDVRAQQLAVEIEEYMSQLACIAAPVKSASGKTIGAVSVSVSASDFSLRARDLERAVRRGAWQVSAQLG